MRGKFCVLLGIIIGVTLGSWLSPASASGSLESVSCPDHITLGQPLTLVVQANNVDEPHQSGWLFSYYLETTTWPEVPIERGNWKQFVPLTTSGSSFGPQLQEFTITIPPEQLPTKLGGFNFWVHVNLVTSEMSYFGNLPGESTTYKREAENSPQRVRFKVMSGSEDLFSPIKGTYWGIFYDTNSPANENAGSFRMTLSRRGAYTARLQQNGKAYAIKGQLGADFQAISSSTVKGESIQLTFQIDQEKRCLSGVVSNQAFASQLLAYQSFPNTSTGGPQRRKYTMVFLAPTNSTAGPNGHGYASLTRQVNGRITLKGKLGDGSRLIQQAAVNASGDWPLYSKPYSGGGSCFGWLKLPESSDGEQTTSTCWTRSPENHGGQIGFTNTIETRTAEWLYSATETPPPWFYDGFDIMLCGGDLKNVTTNYCLSTGRDFLPSEPPYSLKVVVRLNPSSGLFSGSFVHSSLPKKVRLEGALLGASMTGYGFFGGPEQTGGVILAPAGLSGN